MRIISGKYKGKKLLGDNIKGTRPTMDRIKESLFGMIQNKINNSTCLDLFAGSGSLGLEAISNGASTCYFVDNNKIVIDVLNKNLNEVENATIINSDYSKALFMFKEKKIKFDIIFLDPPYKYGLINPAIEKIIEYDLLSENGIIVCEYEEEEIYCNLEIIKEKKYGSKNIRIYQN